MKRICARIMLVCCMGSSPLVVFCAEPATAALVREASTVKGDAYRRVVSSAENLQDSAVNIRTLLAEEGLSPEERLTARILLSRLTYTNVFEKYQETVESFRQRQRSTRPIGTRPGFLSGIVYSFATSGPESRSVSVRTGTRWVGNIKSPKFEQVDRYTAEEVRAGRSRNEAARLAILEHFMKFAEEGSEYEQRELVDAVMRLWGENGHKKHADSISGEVFLEAIAQDETRALSVRVAALTRLPSARRKGERELMIAVLASPNTNSETEHYQVVRQAISHLKRHDPAALNDIATETRWKRLMIGEALGLSTPSEIMPNQDDEIIIDVQE